MICLRPSLTIYSATLFHSVAGRWLRVTGRVLQVNVRTRRALLEHRGAAVAVTLDLLPGVVLRPRSLVQLMGCLVPDDEDADAEGGADVLVLQARQMRPVDGLDVCVYERALAVRRAALGEAMPP